MPPRRLSRAESATISSTMNRLNSGVGEWGRAYRSVMQNSPAGGSPSGGASASGDSSH